MKKTTRGMLVGATTIGALFLASASAMAVEAGSKSENLGTVLSGNNVNAAVNAPVTAAHNAVSVLGLAKTGGHGGHAAKGAVKTGSKSHNTGAVGGGNNVNAGVNAPVTVVENAAAVGGIAYVPARRVGTPAGAAGAGSTSENTGAIASGNNVNAAVNAPITVAHNAIGALGLAKVG